MKTLLAICLLAIGHCCWAQTDTNLLATGDWSAPVTDGKGNDTATLRGRLLVYDVLASDTNNFGHARVYLELQYLKGPIEQGPVAIYYDVGLDYYTAGRGVIITPNASGTITNGIHIQPSIHLEMRDGHDQRYHNEATTINGGFPAPFWIVLPCEATMRLRADLYMLADSQRPNGLQIFVNGGACTIPPHATNDYYLCGTFSSPMDETNPYQQYSAWHGTLNLPKVKIPAR